MALSIESVASPIPESPLRFSSRSQLPPSKAWRSVESLQAGKLEDGKTAACTTAYEKLALAYTEYASLPAQGTRTLLEWKKEEGYRFPAKVGEPALIWGLLRT